MSNIDKLDVRSLKVLTEIYQTRSTYKTASRLNMSQSGVARSLEKLRSTLNDPLFVRGGRALEPSAFCEQIILQLPSLLMNLEQALSNDKTFNPEELVGDITLHINSPSLLLFGHLLVLDLRKRAPNVIWHLMDWKSGTVSALLSGDAAYGIQFRNEDYPKSLVAKKISSLKFCLLARENHPLVNQPVTLDLFDHYSFVGIKLPEWNDTRNRLRASLRKLEKQVDYFMVTEDITMALNIVRQSDYLVPGFENMLNLGDGIVSLEVPGGIQHLQPELVLYSPLRSRQHPMTPWLEERVRSCYKAACIKL